MTTSRLDRGLIRLLLIVCGLCAWATVAMAQSGTSVPRQCTPGRLVRIADLPEASGIAIGRGSPDRLWSHNDSGQPVLVGIDSAGAVKARVRLTGVKIQDWEAIAVGRCPSGSCIYIGDIGDNEARRQRITVYRLPEPASGAATAQVTEAFHATYPDGAHDAETLLVAPDGRLFIVTKGDTGAVGLYGFPAELRAGASHRLERIASPRRSGKPSESQRITDGAVSSDGAWVLLRTNDGFSFYRAADLFSGNWQEAGRIDLKAVGEAQGEGITIADDGTVYLAGEGGGKSQPGTFARMACPVKAGG
jgi:hypothetical protein